MDIVARVALVYVALMIAFRVLGKRELTELSAFDLVTIMLIPEVLSDALQGQGALVDGLVGAAVVFCLVFLTSVLNYRFKRVESIVEGQPTVLVRQGAPILRALDRERVSLDEIYSEMRKQGLEKLSQVKWAILEPDGKVSFVPVEPRTTSGQD